MILNLGVVLRCRSISLDRRRLVVQKMDLCVIVRPGIRVIIWGIQCLGNFLSHSSNRTGYFIYPVVVVDYCDMAFTIRTLNDLRIAGLFLTQFFRHLNEGGSAIISRAVCVSYTSMTISSTMLQKILRLTSVEDDVALLKLFHMRMRVEQIPMSVADDGFLPHL